MVCGPVHLDHSAVAIADDHPGSDLIEGPYGSGRFPTKIAQLGMQSGRIAQRLEQLFKPRATNGTERRLVDFLVNAKNNHVGPVIEEPRPYNVTDTCLDYKIVIPLVAAENGLGQAFRKPQPIPGWS